VHHGVRRIVGRRPFPVIVTTARLTPAPPAAAASAGLRRTVLVVVTVVTVVAVVVGVLAVEIVGFGVTRLALAVGSTLLAASAAATPAATPTAPVTCPAGLVLVVVLVGIVRIAGIVAGIRGVIAAHVPSLAGFDRLRRNEQRHVPRLVHSVVRGDPRRLRSGFLGFLGHPDRCVTEARDVLQGLGEQDLAYPDGILAVDAGMHIASPPVELEERVQHLFVGVAQRPRQLMDPYPVGQVLVLGRVF